MEAYIMSHKAHIESLQKKHDDLRQEIHYAVNHHFSDEKVKELKRKNLAVKDQLLLCYALPKAA